MPRIFGGARCRDRRPRGGGDPPRHHGGVASASLGRPRWTHDIDFFVRPDTAGAALESLERAGFTTQRTNAYWLYKDIRDAVLVDVLFQSRGGIFLDEEMLSGPPASSSTGGTSCRGPRRVLSLLLYALSVDLVVPEAVLQSLFETIIGHPGSDGRRGEQALSVTAAARGEPV